MPQELTEEQQWDEEVSPADEHGELEAESLYVLKQLIMLV